MCAHGLIARPASWSELNAWGRTAGELIHSMAVAVALGAKPADLLKVHWYHPTLSEIWSYPLEDLADELK